MMRRLAVLFIVVLGLAVGYQAVAGVRESGARGRAGGATAAPQKPLVVPEGYEKIVVTADLSAGKPGASGKPAAGKPAVPSKGGSAAKPAPAKPAPDQGAGAAGRGGRGGRRGGMGAGGQGGGCPQTTVSIVLGLSLSQPHGCIVANVTPKGPAGKAGVKSGDSIVEADGKTVTCPSVLAPYLSDTAQPGKVKLTILRRKDAGSAGQKPTGTKPAPGKGTRGGK
jgi:membrane-associated protease RseP (regulator of RpoE activity)